MNLISLTKSKEWLKDNFDYDVEDKTKSNPFINYILEDKHDYPKCNTVFNENINRNYIDEHDDFLIGNSGGLLLNWDFVFINTDIFCESAKHFTKYKTYCTFPKDSLEYKTFWAKETYRRKFGMTANCKLLIQDIPEYFSINTSDKRKKELLKPLTITGDHYSYLNYGRIERTPNEDERKSLDKQGLFKTKTIEDFPRFWDGDYWAYKIDLFCTLNEFNLVSAKARRKGYSYKKSNQSANLLNLNKTVTVINVADDIKYLTDKGALTYMTKINLDWYENNTYWRRGYLSEPLDEIELGYKKKHEGNKSFGYRSKLLSYAINKNTSVAVGKKAIKVNVEEAGKCPKMPEFLDVTFSNLESGAFKIGGFDIWGTGGTKGVNWQYFEQIFYNPKSINGLCFENVWDDDKRHEVCGWFHPQILNYEPYVVDGNSLLFDSFIEDLKDKQKAKLTKDNSNYTIHCAQRANKPSEAFINTTENLFADPTLNAWINDLKTDSKYKFYKDGWYVKKDNKIIFADKETCIVERLIPSWHDFITDVPHTNKTDINGCVREYFSPYYKNGEIPKGLYFITVDPYGVNKDKQDVTDKHSLYSFQVWMYDNGIAPYEGKKLMAEYTGRLNSMKDNDMLLLYACLRWNAKALVEINRGETVSNFKTWGKKDLLLTDPRDYLTNEVVNRIKESRIGMNIGDGETKLNGLTYLKDFIYEKIGISNDESIRLRLESIYSLPFLLELQRFTSTGNWDRISTAILAMYEFKKEALKKRKPIEESNSKNSYFKNLIRK